MLFFYAFFRRFDVENMHRGICVLKQLARGEPLSSAKLLYLRGKREKSTIMIISLHICLHFNSSNYSSSYLLRLICLRREIVTQSTNQGRDKGAPSPPLNKGKTHLLLRLLNNLFNVHNTSLLPV